MAARPAPAPVVPPPTAQATDWRDMPLAAGTWTYVDGSAVSEARYGVTGAPAVVVRCDKAKRQVAIMRGGIGRELVLTTSSGSERFAAGQIDEAGVAMTGAIFAAVDPVLDRMAFSRGRFALALPGLVPLAVPAWAEPARTIEDCRK